MRKFHFQSILLILIVTIITNGFVLALDSPLNHAEGGCMERFDGHHGIQSFGIDNRQKMDSFRYIVGGSQAPILFLASLLGDDIYGKMTLQDVLTNACYFRNTSTEIMPESIATLFGFNQALVSLRSEGHPAGLFIKTNPVEPNGLHDTQFISMTDNHKWACMVGCVQPAGIRTILVISEDPGVPENVQEIIQEHAHSLGFTKPLYFLDYSHCQNAYHHY